MANSYRMPWEPKSVVDRVGDAVMAGALAWVLGMVGYMAVGHVVTLIGYSVGEDHVFWPVSLAVFGVWVLGWMYAGWASGGPHEW